MNHMFSSNIPHLNSKFKNNQHHSSAIISSFQHLKLTRTVVTSFTPRRISASTLHERHFLSDVSSTVTESSFNENNPQPQTEWTEATTSEYDEGDWVLCLASSPPTCNNQTLACALSNGNVQVYDQSTLLPVISNYYPHNSNDSPNTQGIRSENPLITDLLYGPENTIVTSASNGVVIVSDMRLNSHISNRTGEVHTATHTAHSVIRGWVPEAATAIALGYDGYLAAVGTQKGRIHFLDLRKAGVLLASYVNSHTDAITQLKFNHHESPSSSAISAVATMLLSGSEDNLMCLFDTTKPTEELAIQAVMNVGTSVRKVGFCSGNQNHQPIAYCLSGSETMTLWNLGTATCVNDFQSWNLRQNLSIEINQHLQQSQGNIETKSKTLQQHSPIQIDYLIDAHYDNEANQLQLAAGTNAGDVAIFTCTQSSAQINNGMSTYEQLSWEGNQLLAGGHKSLVRAWCPLSAKSSTTAVGLSEVESHVMITAGEDARLCEWSSGKSSPSQIKNRDQKSEKNRPVTNNQRFNHTTLMSASGGGPLRRQHRHKQTSAPY